MHKISYIADGTTCEFEFAFPFFQAADIRVALDSSIQPPEQYSVVENNDFSGGRVVFAQPLPANTQLDIFRQISLSRVIDYQPAAKIDPEHLNADFNFLLAAFQDVYSTELDLTEWRNTHNNIVEFLQYTNRVVEDKLSGGGVLGLYKNLLSVLDGALPQLINDYGYITESVPNENTDDYGLL
ncbi:MAG: hypothetical protein IJ276_02400 [Alphaproteobacteria bacterium]|nr:hypothetical protein [Alphaproteobacteria bacterium]